MSIDCPYCGKPRENKSVRGELVTQLDPPFATYKGKHINLTKYTLAILDLLCRRGVATIDAVSMVGAGPDASSNSAQCQVSILRKRLPKEIKITAIIGWGYQLTFDGSS